MLKIFGSFVERVQMQARRSQIRGNHGTLTWMVSLHHFVDVQDYDESLRVSSSLSHKTTGLESA